MMFDRLDVLALVALSALGGGVYFAAGPAWSAIALGGALFTLLLIALIRRQP